MSTETLPAVLKDLWDGYRDGTSQRLKLIDAYLAYVLLTGVIQFGYCCIVGTFPFNSFLSGFISTVGCFVLGGEHSVQTVLSAYSLYGLSLLNRF